MTVKSKGKRKINLFSSVTVISVLLTLFLAAAPKLGEMLDAETLKPSDVINLLSILASSSLTVLAAYNENTKLITPKFMPGRNESEED